MVFSTDQQDSLSPLTTPAGAKREQPRPQGLLAFQYGGGRREDPGTQRTKTIADWCIS